ncbi:MAG: hypothetical protein AAGH15_05525 [Myxococcota bacterium]
MRRRLALLALLAAAGGCADDTLDGSLGAVYPLGFSDVRARLYSSSLSIEYVRGDGSVPVRLTLDREFALANPRDIDLRMHGDLTGRLANDQEIPRFTEGEATISPIELDPVTGELLTPRVTGSFGARFQVNPDEVLALDGSFDAAIELVDDPGPPPPGR